MKEKIIFKGFCGDVVSELSDANVFVLTSKYEGMPNSLMEAMALGIPSITTDCFGNDGEYKLVESGQNAIMIPRDDEVALAKAIDELLSNKEFANKIAYNATKVRDTFSPTIIYKRWEDLIKTIIHGY